MERRLPHRGNAQCADAHRCSTACCMRSTEMQWEAGWSVLLLRVGSHWACACCSQRSLLPAQRGDVPAALGAAEHAAGAGVHAAVHAQCGRRARRAPVHGGAARRSGPGTRARAGVPHLIFLLMLPASWQGVCLWHMRLLTILLPVSCSAVQCRVLFGNQRLASLQLPCPSVQSSMHLAEAPI